MGIRKHLQTGTWCGSLLRGSARALLIQMRMLAAIHGTEHGTPMEERERTEGTEGVCNPIGRTTISTNQTVPSSPRSFQGLRNQLESRHVGTHVSRHKCSRERHCLASIEGEALGPVKTPFPSVGECQGVEVGVYGWESEHPLRSMGRRGGEWAREKGDNIWNVNR